MNRPLEGVRVIELAAWTFVPASGAVLAEWGADVIKVEHPEGGDPQRGLVATGLVPGGDANAVNHMMEQPNHNKRSIGINLKTPEGREVLLELCKTADVFVTNWLPGPRSRAKLDVEDIRAVNPNIIYVRGHGQGARGPDADKGGYDGSSYWARAGVVEMLSNELPYGPQQPAAFGDLAGGQTIAGGIAAALYRRAVTGEAQIVDVSLLALGMWVMSPTVVAHKLFGDIGVPFGQHNAPNPIANRYMTKDGRMVYLMMLQSGRYWPELMHAIGRDDLIADSRFADAVALYENREEAIRLLNEIFATKTLAEWREILDKQTGVWAAAQRPIELHDDPQAIANGYIADVKRENASSFGLVANPVQFDETPPTLLRAPDAGEHTDEILQEIGLDWDRIIELKTNGAVQ
jgi:crotonobetainyl-CoA:carnitine CoA-transferase CaiB-like acyl-CoA transferase